MFDLFPFLAAFKKRQASCTSDSTSLLSTLCQSIQSHTRTQHTHTRSLCWSLPSLFSQSNLFLSWLDDQTQLSHLEVYAGCLPDGQPRSAATGTAAVFLVLPQAKNIFRQEHHYRHNIPRWMVCHLKFQGLSIENCKQQVLSTVKAIVHSKLNSLCIHSPSWLFCSCIIITYDHVCSY